MTISIELVLRRAVVVIALLVFVGVGTIVYLRMRTSAQVRGLTFFEDTSAIADGFKRALGPEPPVIELAIEPEEAAVLVVVSPEASRRYTLRRDTGFVVAGPVESLPSSDEVAFSLSTVPFAELPAMIAGADLGTAPSRLVVDRPPGARILRYQLYAEDGARFVEIAPGTIR